MANQLLRMDNIGIVVEDMEAAIAFFVELGMELEGRTTVEGELVDRLIRLEGVKSEIAFLRMPDGCSKLELSRFHTPPARKTELNPVNTLGIGRLMFAVRDIEDVLARLQKYGATLHGELVTYGDQYRLFYVRGPEGVMIALAEQLNGKR